MTSPPLLDHSSKFMKAMDLSMARIGDIDVSVGALWDAARCPVDLLPWLAWGLSIDIWNAGWSEAQKRAAIMNTIPDQARKGTRASLVKILQTFDPLINLVEWFEAEGSGVPGTFDVNIPVDALTFAGRTADFAEAIIRDIVATKRLSAHMTMVQKVSADLLVWLAAGAQVAGYVRDTATADQLTALAPIWNLYIQSEDGEPIQAEDGQFLEVE
jgi:phage tail P2-like protein